MAPAARRSAPAETPQAWSAFAPSVAAVRRAIVARRVALNARRRLEARARPFVIAANGAITLSGPSVTNKKVNASPSDQRDACRMSISTTLIQSEFLLDQTL